MEQQNITVTERRTNMSLPRFDFIDILTVIALILIGALLLSDRPVPEYMIALVTLGAGIKMRTDKPFDKSDLG